MIETFLVARDDTIYEAFPDVALAPSGRLVCVFAECTHHADRGYTCMKVCTSDDRGRTWSTKRPVTEELRGDPATSDWFNCPRVSALSDGRLVMAVDRNRGREVGLRETRNVLYFSEDEGESWSEPVETPVKGIVPDQLIELRVGPRAGRWLLGAHSVLQDDGRKSWAMRYWHSDDGGTTWSGPSVAACEADLQLCEGSVVELPGGELVCFLRENSGQGLDAFKTISRDGGETWGDAVRFPLPACHRPVAGMLNDGNVLITHRFMQGGKGWVGSWTQNVFAAVTSVEACLAGSRGGAGVRIRPLDFDRSPVSDLGYTGWVQFDDGEIYVVNYIVDDAPNAHIRGYSLRMEDFLLPAS